MSICWYTFFKISSFVFLCVGPYRGGLISMAVAVKAVEGGSWVLYPESNSHLSAFSTHSPWDEFQNRFDVAAVLCWCCCCCCLHLAVMSHREFETRRQSGIQMCSFHSNKQIRGTLTHTHTGRGERTSSNPSHISIPVPFAAIRSV